ncbi:hypothetical protein B7P43_G07075 [Cryptotermes secundus]|uniref:Uncharacterized protein n=1 Tax=Cryptotermes secundus TaxID=105785 RepID=A0A2J7RHB9_9NEOP|nr:hypothetical protein B7P43_G07075 [Cryptotermes secundus]
MITYSERKGLLTSEKVCALCFIFTVKRNLPWKLPHKSLLNSIYNGITSIFLYLPVSRNKHRKSKYMLLSRHQNAWQNHDLKIVNGCFVNVVQFRYFGYLMQEEIKRRLNSGNACYHSVKKLLSCRLLFKNIQIRICKTMICEERNAYRILVGKSGRRPLGDNIKMNLSEIGWCGMDWIDLAQDMGRWRAFVNTVMHLRVP